MKIDYTNGCRTRTVVLLLLAAAAIGCGGSGGGGDVGVIAPPSALTAAFSGSGMAMTADTVRATGSSAGDLVTVELAIGGPTSSRDLYSFAFDLELGDATVAEFLDGSASTGTALTTSGSQSLQVLARQIGDRVTVGVTKVGGGAGNGVDDPGEAVVVELVFRVLRAGTTTLTIVDSPGNEPAALDSGGDEIGSISFDTAPATLIGR